MSISLDGRVVGETFYLHENKAPTTNNPLAKLWKGRCTIYEYKDKIDPNTKLTTQELVPTVTDEPCRVSYTRETSSLMANGAAITEQITMLFIRPDLDIKAGSVIEVTQNGRTIKYKRASLSAIYTNHQEIVLELYEDNI
jgi:hypothetical protein